MTELSKKNISSKQKFLLSSENNTQDDINDDMN
jgi:hypothetical protein